MNFIKNLTLFTCLWLVASNANAILSITISDSSDPMSASAISVTDGGAGDLSSYSGEVGMLASLGAFQTNFVFGAGDPSIGNVSYDEIDLGSYNVSSTAGGELWVFLTQTDLTRSPAQFNINFGGTTDGKVEYQSYINDVLVSDSGALSGGFSGSDSGSTKGFGNSYTWTIVAHITHFTGGSITSFDYNVRIPEPTTLALLGIGLLCIGFISRKKRVI